MPWPARSIPTGSSRPANIHTTGRPASRNSRLRRRNRLTRSAHWRSSIATSNGCTAARSSRRDAMRSASSSGSLITRAICSYCSAVVSGFCPERSAAITGAPGQICSIGSHLLRPTRIFMRIACSQISASSAVLPIPAGPEITTLELVPCWLALRNADSALAIGSLRPRNGPDRTAPPQETAYLLARVTGAAPSCIARSGDVQSAVGGHAGQLDPRLDSQTRNCCEGWALTVCDDTNRYLAISRLVLPSRDSHCRTTASQSRRTGLCGRAALWRSSARRCRNTDGPAGLGHDYAFYPRGHGRTHERERVAVSLLDCALPARTSMFSPERVSALGAAVWLESARWSAITAGAAPDGTMPTVGRRQPGGSAWSSMAAGRSRWSCCTGGRRPRTRGGT